MALFKPKYITFDCYGTLTRFRMSEMAREMFADRIAAEKMDDFVRDFATYRLDEVLGPWKPYRDLLVNAIHRTGKLWGIKTTDAEGEAYLQRGSDLGSACGCSGRLAKWQRRSRSLSSPMRRTTKSHQRRKARRAVPCGLYRADGPGL